MKKSIFLLLASFYFFSCSKVLEKKISEASLNDDLRKIYEHDNDSTSVKSILSYITLSTFTKEKITGKTYKEIIGLQKESGIEITSIPARKVQSTPKMVELVVSDSTGADVKMNLDLSTGKRLTIMIQKNRINKSILAKIFGKYPDKIVDSLVKSTTGDVIMLQPYCINTCYCMPVSGCVPGHIIYYPGPYSSQIGPFAGDCCSTPAWCPGVGEICRGLVASNN